MRNQFNYQLCLTAFRLILCFGFTSHLAAASSTDAKMLFISNCAPCHGKEGKANTPAARKLGVKDLTKSKTKNAEIENQILEGKADKRGVLKMPPFKDKLAPNEIKSLVDWVLSLRK